MKVILKTSLILHYVYQNTLMLYKTPKMCFGNKNKILKYTDKPYIKLDIFKSYKIQISYIFRLI